MPSRHAVHTLLLPSGERLPILINRIEGRPCFDATLFVLTQLRQTNAASATIERALREIMVLQDFLFVRNICLNNRFREGRMLSLAEVDGLVNTCSEPTKSIHPQQKRLPPRIKNSTISLEQFRLRQQEARAKVVAPKTAANRIRTIQSYLTWLTESYLSQHGLDLATRHALEQNKNKTIAALAARLPRGKGRNQVGQREGLAPEMLNQLLEVIDPTSPDNPWRDQHARVRNALIVYWLWHLGVRRGELLNVKISDINFMKNEVLIARRADDPEDPRRNQPRVKTRDRILPLSANLAEATHHYIVNVRTQLKGARKHAFLFVAEHSGTPLSLPALNKVFSVLRSNCPSLPDELSPHVLRHCWNDHFSQRIDKKGQSEEVEKKMRAYLMGWSPTSQTVNDYTRRHVRKQARKASLELQAAMIAGRKIDNE